MTFTNGENIIEYISLKSAEECPIAMDILFEVGKATEIIYVTAAKIADGSMRGLVETLTEFCASLPLQNIVFSIDATSSDVSKTVTRYALQTAGFRSFGRFVDDEEAAIFMYWNAESNKVFTRLFDEYLAREMHDILLSAAEGDTSRIDKFLEVLGPSEADSLLKHISLFLSKGTAPQRMSV